MSYAAIETEAVQPCIYCKMGQIVCWVEGASLTRPIQRPETIPFRVPNMQESFYALQDAELGCVQCDTFVSITIPMVIRHPESHESSSGNKLQQPPVWFAVFALIEKL